MNYNIRAMIQNILKFISIIILIICIIINDISSISNYIKNKYIQLYIALFIIFILVFIDNLAGFILGLSLLLIYFKVYHKELKIKNNIVDKPITKCNGNKECFLDNTENKKTEYIKIEKETGYTTAENLLDAQNNIINVENYNKELLGTDDILTTQKIYGAQGLDNDHNHFMGNDLSIAFLGGLSYAVLDKE